MALAFAHLTTDISDANASSYDTASFTTTVDRPVWVGILIADSNPAGTPSLSKTGVTLSLVSSIEFDTAGTRRTIFLFEGVPTSTSTGTMSITATEAIVGCGWTVSECTGHDAADQIEGTAATGSGSGTSLSATLTSFGARTSDAAFAVFATDADGSYTSDFTILGQDQSAAASPAQAIGSAWKVNDNTFTATGPSGLWGVVAVQVRVAGGAEVIGEATLTGTGSLTATGTHTAIGAATLSGAGSVAGTALHTGLGEASLSGSGTLTATGTQDVLAGATLTGVGSLTAEGARTVLGEATLTGTGDLTATGTATVLGEATLTGISSLTVMMPVPTVGKQYAGISHLFDRRGYPRLSSARRLVR